MEVRGWKKDREKDFTFPFEKLDVLHCDLCGKLSSVEMREKMYEKEGLLPLIPLMKVENPEKILSKVVERIDRVKDRSKRLELQPIWYILSGIRYNKEFLDRFLRKEMLMESTAYKAILKEGIEKGIEKGIYLKKIIIIDFLKGVRAAKDIFKSSIM